MIGHSEKEAIAAIVNIDNALLQLEMFSQKRQLSIPYIQQVIDRINDGGLDERDAFRAGLFASLLSHLRKLERLE